MRNEEELLGRMKILEYRYKRIAKLRQSTEEIVHIRRLKTLKMRVMTEYKDLSNLLYQLDPRHPVKT